MTNFPSLPTSVTALNLLSTPSDDPSLTLAGTVLSVPDLYTDLNRTIDITGLLLNALSDDGSIQVQTAAGQLAIDLSASLQNSQTLDTAQSALATAFDGRKPVTITLSPGNPPTQAWVEIDMPQAPRSTSLTNDKLTAPLTTVPPQQTQPQKGDLWQAFLLPHADSKPTETVPHQEPTSTKETSAQTAGAKSAAEFKTDALASMMANKADPTSGKQAATQAERHSALSTAFSGAKPVYQPGLSSAAQKAQPLAQTLRFEAVIDDPKQAPPLSARQMVATVSGQSDNGPTFLTTAENDTFIVRTRLPWPEGTRIIVSREDGLPSPRGLSGADDKDDKAMASDRLAALLNQKTADPALQLLQTRLPQANNALPTTVLFIFQILKNGDVERLLGADVAAKMDKKDKDELARTLSQVFAQPQTEVKDAVVGQWQQWHLPIHAGGAFQQAALYVHHDADEASAGAINKIRKTRFLVSVTLSRLGPIQLDGLVQGKQLDLIVRSESPLPPDLPASLQQSWFDTLESMGLQGQLRFQNGRQNWLNMEPIAPASPQGILT